MNASLRYLIAGCLTVACIGWLCAGEPTGKRALPGRGPGANPPPVVAWNEAEIVFIANLEEAVAGPTANSFPPIHNHTLKFTVNKVLRGSLQPKDTITAHNAARQVDVPLFPIGQRCLVAVSTSRDAYSILRLEEADDAKIAAAEKLCALPLGWKYADDKAISPWSKIDKPWPGKKAGDTTLTDSVTGRPALMVGSNVKFAVEFIATNTAKGAHPEWVNPDGDGEYQIKLTNDTKVEQEVPALLTDGKNILWKECVLIQCQGKVYRCPGSKGLSEPVESVKLKPGESISTVVNALQLEGPEWPRGGYRIEFQFCLGEKSQTKSFYYMSSHHDAIRTAAQGSKNQ